MRGCPIQALLGWDVRPFQLRIQLLTLGEAFCACVECVRSHPSKAWMGHPAVPVDGVSSLVARGFSPANRFMRGERLRPLRRLASRAIPQGLKPFFLTLNDVRAKALTCLICTGAPSKLCLGGMCDVSRPRLQFLTLGEAFCVCVECVPSHPSGAWMGHPFWVALQTSSTKSHQQSAIWAPRSFVMRVAASSTCRISPDR